jgi:hypothetical protein
MVSGRLTPAATTLMRTSPGFGCGTGRVPILSTSGPPGWVISTARMVLGMVIVFSVWLVILSEAKDLLLWTSEKQILPAALSE